MVDVFLFCRRVYLSLTVIPLELSSLKKDEKAIELVG